MVQGAQGEKTCPKCGGGASAPPRVSPRSATLGRQAPPTGSQSEQAAALPSNAATTGVACPRCGTENAPSARSCKRCLANLNQQGQAISPVPEAKRGVGPRQPPPAGGAG